MKELIRNYKSLRETIGWIGILLPFVLMVGGFCKEVGLQESISDYYYSNMGDVFVGSMCAVGLFLFFYVGYDHIDNILGNIAGVLSIGVALFPTNQGADFNIIGLLHIICAGLLFIILSIFSIFLFTRGKKSNPEKKKRNIVYIICGIIMLSSIAALGLYSLITKTKGGVFMFIAESVALIAFGISWLTKGGTLFFPDKHKKIKPNRRKKYLLARNVHL